MFEKKSKMNIEELNRIYTPLSPEDRIRRLFTEFPKILFTSSFGASSVYLLHLVSKLRPEQAVYFLNTTYHFPETLDYKKVLTELLNLNVIDLKGDEHRNLFTSSDRTWEKDTELCCSINKVEPLEKIKSEFQVWISGLMKSQNSHRKDLPVFEYRGGILKFYPIVDQTEEQVCSYIRDNQLPDHPLQNRGFHSIGCSHCTSKGIAREGRWINRSKTECGLHL